ncbi:hypothetical protein FSP39_006242 [Pinctada imbricata]|uniref:Beta-1,4-glucuronyltransferase 1 n=1 Tax=Pinctada imbricata TaxID=66713 RepID=A0AA89BJ60_PINIB|nr:hypothetical protein FSP39_006242 [Pinctada imbricata]
MQVQNDELFPETITTDVSNIKLKIRENEIIFKRWKDVFISDFRKQMLTDQKIRDKDINTITLATQCSVENLHFVDSLTDRWNGPISVAVFIDRNDAMLVRFVEYYYQCFENIRANTTFHLVYPENMGLGFSEVNCEEFRAHADEDILHMKPLTGLRYPYNVMRNLAIPQDRTGFMFFIDIDMVPSFNLHDEFLKYARTLEKETLDTSIFIVPSFESNNPSDIPGTKVKLIQRIITKEIRIFHLKTCGACQYNTNYLKWKYLKNTTMSTYEIESKFFNYEPFYIIRSDKLIPYNEAFVGRGYDRISQVCEMWMAGFKFRVLSDAFLVHRGFHNTTKLRKRQCPLRKKKKYVNSCVRKPDILDFYKIVAEIDQKRHINKRNKESLRMMDEEERAEMLMDDPNRELFWGFVEELEKKYNGTGRMISQEWYF